MNLCRNYRFLFSVKFFEYDRQCMDDKPELDLNFDGFCMEESVSYKFSVDFKFCDKFKEVKCRYFLMMYLWIWTDERNNSENERYKK